METYRTVKVVLLDANGKVLLLRRSKTHPTQAYVMDPPGGILEEGEDPATALSREILEETGLKIPPSSLHLVFGDTEQTDEKSAVRLVFVCQLTGVRPKIKLSWEHDDYEWLTVDEAIVRQPEGRYTRRALEYITQNKIIDRYISKTG